MHELSICDAVARAVGEYVPGRRVLAVHLRVGALRQVVPDTLQFCWTLAVRDTELDGARLEIDEVPGEVACTACGARSTLSRFVLRCPGCDGPVRVVAGEELDVVAVEIDDQPDGALSRPRSAKE